LGSAALFLFVPAEAVVPAGDADFTEAVSSIISWALREKIFFGLR
jgi:hypothetical protein